MTTIEYNRHHLSNPFGEAARTDREELERSMREHGYDVRHPITLYEGDILDGWHRYHAAIKAGIEPVFEEFTGTYLAARHFVYRENLARRQMTQKQKATALLIMNTWLRPDEALSLAGIQERCGIKSPTVINQLRRLAEHNPDLAQQVARGATPADSAIRQLSEDPADHKGGTDPASGRGEIIFVLKKPRLIVGAHKARLRVGMTKQSLLNKAIELFIEWAEGQPEGYKAT